MSEMANERGGHEGGQAEHDLLQRLRRVEPAGGDHGTTRWSRNPDGAEAADEIEGLRARIRALETALASEVNAFRLRCQMLGFEPVTEDFLARMRTAMAVTVPEALPDFERLVAHLRTTGTVQP